jgi:hypothetical protein
MSGVVRTLSRCLLPAEAGARERRAGAARDAEREARRRSRDIDALLARERRAVRRLGKILLLGAGESGKSTFLKQMRIIHGREFDQKALLEFRDTIFDNILKVRGPRPCRPPASRRPPGPHRGHLPPPVAPDRFGDGGSGSWVTSGGGVFGMDAPSGVASLAICSGVSAPNSPCPPASPERQCRGLSHQF